LGDGHGSDRGDRESVHGRESGNASGHDRENVSDRESGRENENVRDHGRDYGRDRASDHGHGARVCHGRVRVHLRNHAAPLHGLPRVLHLRPRAKTLAPRIQLHLAAYPAHPARSECHTPHHWVG